VKSTHSVIRRIPTQNSITQSPAAGNIELGDIAGCTAIAGVAAWDRTLTAFAELTDMDRERLPAMRPDAARADQELAAVFGTMRGRVIPVGLVGPKAAEVLRITGGPVNPLGGTGACAEQQEDHPSNRPTKKRLSHLSLGL
jgi:hypothetical protein